MKISAKLEEMVADLVSDERQKREEVEAILSQIHELTAAYFDPERQVAETVVPEQRRGAFPEHLERNWIGKNPEPTLEDQLQNQIAFFLKSGDDQFTAERKAKMALGID